MKKEYFVRGKKVEVEEVPGVVALKIEAGPEAKKTLAGVDISPLEAKGADLPIPSEEKNAFQQAGWVFIRPTPEISKAFTAKETPEGASSAGKVFIHPSGRTMVGTDRLTVKLQPEIPEEKALSILGEAGLEVVRKLNFAPNLFEVRVVARRDSLDVALELHDRPEFIYAEPQMIEHIPPRFTPSDPDYRMQWQWKNDGSSEGKAGADIGAETAWEFTRGEGVKLAVIDNGMNVNHPDLKDAVYKSGAFFKERSGGDTELIIGTGGFPAGNHGTFCSGIAVARANNGINGCGVACEAAFIPLACLGDQVGTQVTLARAVAYAAEPTTDPAAEAAGLEASDGADVISCSLGPNGADWEMQSVLQDAIDSAVTRGRGGLGTPVFWAVSNGNFPVVRDEVSAYANTIAVGRSTRGDMDHGSAFGPELDFLAPGVDVQSTTSTGFGRGTGTSYAAPCAAGVGALLLAANPGLKWDQVRQIMSATCEKVGGVTYSDAGHHDRFGHGRVNAAKAVCAASGLGFAKKMA